GARPSPRTVARRCARSAEPVEAWRSLVDELRRYSPELYAKPRLVVGSKCFEEDTHEDRLAELAAAVAEDAPPGTQVLGMNSILGIGLEEVLRALQIIVRSVDAD
ncbi:MAG: hypothetical protein AAFP22_09330, partial [Planctomycetota bacterium]